MPLHVSALYRYPIKSAGANTLSEADVTLRGFAHDRRWMIVDADGRFLSQRTHPRLAHLSVEVLPEGLHLRAEGMPPLLTGPIGRGRVRRVRVWDDEVDAVDASEASGAWLSQFLNAPCRIVYMPESTRRRVDPAYGAPGDVVSFADAYPLLLTTEASLADLNGRLEEPVTMARFRPNVVLDGDIPYEEDTWRAVQIGEVRLRTVKPCVRCAVITLDPVAGEFQKEPLRTLASYRRSDGKVLFGQNAIPDGIGRIRVGDPVRVLG